MGKVTSVITYPVKGFAGIVCDSGEVQRRGLKNDRRYLIVDGADSLVSQREHSVMALMSGDICADGIRISFRGTSLDVKRPQAGGSRRMVKVWYSETSAADCGDEAAEWLSGALGFPVRLTYMDEQAVREPSKNFLPDDEVSFADAFPIMVASEASLADLNTRLESPVPMNRFRPNVVVSGFEPWAEDTWTTLTIGGIALRAVANCGRCLVTTIDQSTGEKTGSEPLRTLGTFRTIGQQIVFGRYVIPDTLGEIRVGDEVSVNSIQRSTA